MGEHANDRDAANLAFKRLAVTFGKKILAIIPGRVPTEVDARLSYDGEATVQQAREVVRQYDDAGISRERLLNQDCST